MLNFPKEYKKTKINKIDTTQQQPFFYLPEYATEQLTLGSIFRFFVLDFLYHTYYNSSFPVNTTPFFLFNKQETKQQEFFKNQLKQFWLSHFLSHITTKYDPEFIFNAQEFFTQQLRDGIIFEDRFLVYWSPSQQTPISFDNISYEETTKKRYILKYFVSTKNHSLDIQTNSPETIFWDVAIALHPQHKKAKQLKWQEAIIPIINKTIPIIIDERADFTRYWWVYRVTPGHDKLWLEIAKDHNLPIDVYAIDKNGLFTEHAWLFAKKDAEHFFSNITQSLSDIGNLIKTEDFIWKNALFQEEKLVYRNWKGFFIKLPEDYISQELENASLSSIFNQKENYFDISYRLASAHNTEWIRIPLWYGDNQKIVIADTQWLSDCFSASGNKEWFVLWLFLLHCINMGLLSPIFSSEDFVECIINYKKNNPDWLKKLFELFDSKVSSTKETKTILNILSEEIENKDIDKKITSLIWLLDTSFCLIKNKYHQYCFVFDRENKEEVFHQSEQTLSYDIILTILLLQTQQQISLDKELPIYIHPHMKNNMIRSCLFTSFYHKKTFTNTINTLPLLLDDTSTPILFIKNNHPDCIRLSFLMLATKNKKYTDQLFIENDQILSTFRNACRYIKLTFFWDKQSISLKEITNNLNKHIDDFSTFDSWILSKLQEIIDDYKQINNTESFGNYWDRIFSYIKQDLSIKYLELIKTSPSEYSETISIYIIWILLQLLKPYIPNITYELWNTIWFKEDFTTWNIVSYKLEIQKNYLISLFMDIIDKFAVIKTSLWLKKHNFVDIFIRSNPDFISFAKNNEHLLQKVLHAENIQYLVHHDPLPSNYKIDDIIDISIGLRAHIKEANCWGIVFLQKQLKEKEEYLQQLKHFVQQLNNGWWDPSIIQQKKEEICKIKEEIEELNFEISKCKMK